MQYDNTNRGALWKNTEMRPDKRDPHFQGTINIDGKEYQLSAWKPDPDKVGPKTPVLSISVREKAPAQPQHVEQAAPQATAQDINDEIPW